MPKTAINITRSAYPDVVDECHRVAELEERSMTKVAVRLLRQALGLTAKAKDLESAAQSADAG
jgi:hypothetical protein